MIQISLRVNSNLLRMQIYSTTKFSRLVLNVKYNRVLRIKILTFIKKKETLKNTSPKFHPQSRKENLKQTKLATRILIP